MKRLALGFILMGLCLAVGAVALAGDEGGLPDRVVLYYFYDELCGSCDGVEAFDAAAQEALAGVRELYPYEIHRLNVYTQAGKEKLDAVCGEMGLDADTLTLPVLIAGGRVFQGDETIASSLREAFLVAGEDLFVNGRVYNPAERKTGDALFEDYQADPEAVTVVYFYRITCEECEQTAPVIDSLPQAVTAGGTSAPVEVIRINTRSGNNGERVSAFFEGYAVADEDRMVPIAFVRDQYFAGYEAISAGLAAALETTAPGFVFPAAE